MAYVPFRPDDFEKIPFGIRAGIGRMGDRIYSTYKFGYNSAISTAYEDVWSPGGTLSLLSAADTMNVSSASADDKGTPTAGTGARTIRLVGVDGSYNVITEDVTLNGQTAVATTSSFLRVYRAYVLTAGTGGVNAGAITIEDDGGSTTQCSIPAGYGQSEMAIYTIRAGYYGVITDFSFSSNVKGTDTLSVELTSVSEGGVMRVRYSVIAGGVQTVNNEYAERQAPIVIDPKTDVIVRAIKTGAGADASISASFSVLEIKAEEVNL